MIPGNLIRLRKCVGRESISLRYPKQNGIKRQYPYTATDSPVLLLKAKMIRGGMRRPFKVEVLFGTNICYFLFGSRANFEHFFERIT